MLQNAYFLAKIGADTAESEQHFAENLPKIGNYPTGPSAAPTATATYVRLDSSEVDRHRPADRWRLSHVTSGAAAAMKRGSSVVSKIAKFCQI